VQSGVSCKGKKVPHAVQVASFSSALDQQKGAWLESDFCVSSASFSTALLTMWTTPLKMHQKYYISMVIFKEI